MFYLASYRFYSEGFFEPTTNTSIDNAIYSQSIQAKKNAGNTRRFSGQSYLISVGLINFATLTPTFPPNDTDHQQHHTDNTQDTCLPAMHPFHQVIQV